MKNNTNPAKGCTYMQFLKIMTVIILSAVLYIQPAFAAEEDIASAEDIQFLKNIEKYYYLFFHTFKMDFF